MAPPRHMNIQSLSTVFNYNAYITVLTAVWVDNKNVYMTDA